LKKEPHKCDPLRMWVVRGKDGESLVTVCPECVDEKLAKDPMHVLTSDNRPMEGAVRNHYIFTRHIRALRDLLDNGIGLTGKPLSARRRKEMQKAIVKMERELELLEE
jgi:hypothetical protein